MPHHADAIEILHIILENIAVISSMVSWRRLLVASQRPADKKNKKGTAINKPGTSIMTQSVADNALNSASKRSSNHRSHFQFTKIQAKSNRHCTSRDDRSRQHFYLETAQEYQESQSNHRNCNRTREKDVASMQSKRSKATSSHQPSKNRRHDRGIRTSRDYSLENDIGYDFLKTEGAGH